MEEANNNNKKDILIIAAAEDAALSQSLTHKGKSGWYLEKFDSSIV